MTARQALDDLIREREETYAAVSRLLGRNTAYIQQYIKRGTPARLDQSDIAQLALHFDVPAKLLGGKESPSTPRRSVITVPVIEAKGLEIARERSRIVDEAWLKRLCNRPAGLAILPIAGEAMQPTLQNGDEVIIQRLRSHDALQDGLYAVRGSSETFVRRIALDPTKNRISVLTDHPAYPSWNGVQRKAINVVGRVIWIGSQVS
ncbi:S24 family peptidase [Qipengyuania oceanensis]|uniref:Peptidase S24 n=1 Tax=Qipengyuania oceanensis TaxID=1463597 RepID=A0A844YEY4_9SPHN|nr:S24 family peptidase [Qipengyuania oceanensis]MXO63696.1 peptidase S24 [Qipengyuania oceanensis]